MMLYFAHPIDQDNGQLARIGNSNVRRDLLEHFDWVFDPAGAFTATSPPIYDARVQDINDLAILEADAVFALLPPGVPTVGTVTEIHRAAQAGKPVTVYCQTRPIGLGRLPDNVDFWLSDAIPAHRHDDIREAARSLRQRAEAYQDQPILLLPAEDKEAARAHVRDIVGNEPGSEFCYSGPLQAVRKYDGDAAWDVPSAETVKLRIGDRRRIKTGVYIAPPDDVWVSMVGRSSMFGKGLFCEPGVIDAGWRGELEVKVYNLANEPVTIEAGERIAQLIPHRIVAQQLVPLDVGGPENLPYGDRGTNGWGSTGS